VSENVFLDDLYFKFYIFLHILHLKTVIRDLEEKKICKVLN